MDHRTRSSAIEASSCSGDTQTDRRCPSDSACGGSTALDERARFARPDSACSGSQASGGSASSKSHTP